MSAASAGATALHDDGYRFVVPVEPEPADYDAQGHLNNAAIVRIFNDLRIAYIRAGIGDRWPEHLRTEGLVVVAREVHVLYESEGKPSDVYVGAMRYVRREGRAAVIEQRLVEAGSARPVARAWVVQLLARDGTVADWPGFYFDLVAEVEGREIEQRPSIRREWGPGIVSDAQAGLAEGLRLQASFCAHTGSPFYAALLERMAVDVEAGGPTWTMLEPHAHESLDEAYRLRLLGGVHRMVLAGDAPKLAAHFPTTGGDGDVDAMWPAYREVLAARPEMVLDALRRPPQTNEVGRSAALAGGLAVVAQRTQLPLRVLEIGTSAALNLRCDRYWYEHKSASWGDPTAAVRFVDLWSPARPPFGADLLIASRRGCDRNPIDAAAEGAALTLLSYVWPGQDARFQALRDAIDIAAAFPVTVDRADAVAWVPERLGESRPGLTTVVMHSVFWQYLGADAQASITAALAAAGARATADAPLAWLRLEPTPTSRPELRLTIWPGGNEEHLATAGFHAGPVEWYR